MLNKKELRARRRTRIVAQKVSEKKGFYSPRSKPVQLKPEGGGYAYTGPSPDAGFSYGKRTCAECGAKVVTPASLDPHCAFCGAVMGDCDGDEKFEAIQEMLAKSKFGGTSHACTVCGTSFVTSSDEISKAESLYCTACGADMPDTVAAIKALVSQETEDEELEPEPEEPSESEDEDDEATSDGDDSDDEDDEESPETEPENVEGNTSKKDREETIMRVKAKNERELTKALRIFASEGIKPIVEKKGTEYILTAEDKTVSAEDRKAAIAQRRATAQRRSAAQIEATPEVIEVVTENEAEAVKAIKIMAEEGARVEVIQRGTKAIIRAQETDDEDEKGKVYMQDDEEELEEAQEGGDFLNAEDEDDEEAEPVESQEDDAGGEEPPAEEPEEGQEDDEEEEVLQVRAKSEEEAVKAIKIMAKEGAKITVQEKAPNNIIITAQETDDEDEKGKVYMEEEFQPRIQSQEDDDELSEGDDAGDEEPPAEEPEEGQEDEEPPADDDSAEAVRYEALSDADSLKNIEPETVNMTLHGESSENPHWNIELDGEPVAKVTLLDQQKPEEIRAAFISHQYAEGVKKAILDMGPVEVFQMVRAKLYANQVVETKLAKKIEASVKKSLKTEHAKRLASVRDELLNCMKLAVAGFNKNYWSKDESHELKDSLWNGLKKVGLSNPTPIIEASFEEAGDKFFEQVANKAIALMDMPTDVRNVLAETIGENNLISLAEDDEDEIPEAQDEDDLPVVQRMAQANVPVQGMGGYTTTANTSASSVKNSIRSKVGGFRQRR